MDSPFYELVDRGLHYLYVEYGLDVIEAMERIDDVYPA
jgi:hypothetical protein